MDMQLIKFVLIVAAFLQTSFALGNESIKALLYKSSEDQDSSTQAEILNTGISQRCFVPIDWTISEVGKIDVSETFDIVIYHQDDSKVVDSNLVDNLLALHKDGIPALILNNGLHSYPTSNEWKEFCGAKVTRSGSKQTQKVLLESVDHSILKNLPKEWVTSPEESSSVLAKSAGALVLSSVMSAESETSTPVCWTHIYNKKARVFATTLGSATDSIKQTNFLDLVSASFIWALGKSGVEGAWGSGLKQVYDSRINFGENLLADQIVASSSGQSANVSDGDFLTVWQPDEQGLSQWLLFQLEQPIHAKAIAIGWQYQIDHPFVVEYSTDGEKWLELAVGEVVAGGATISLFDCDAEFGFLRVRNPTLIGLNPIREIVSYSSKEKVPFHVQTLSKVKSTTNIKSVKTPPASNREPVLSKQKAFAMVDDHEKRAQWGLAFDELGLMHDTDVVDGVIERLNRTQSGLFRHKALATLGNLYRNDEGVTWDGSSKIAESLNKQLGNQRINPEVILSIFTRNAIPVSDVNKIFSYTNHYQHSIKGLQVKLLLQNEPLPASTNYFLRTILRNEFESKNVRIKATELLAAASDQLGIKDVFELVAESDDNLLNQARIFLQLNLAWEDQLEWLISKTEDDYGNIRGLGWEILLQLLNNPRAKQTTVDLIVEEIDRAQREENSYRYRTFLNKVKNPKHPSVLEIIEKSIESKDDRVSYAARLVINRQSTQKKVAGQSIAALPVSSLLKEIAGDERSKEATKGREIFKNRCSVCHESRAPSLSNFSKQGELEAMIRAILEPNLAIKKGFSTHTIEMNDNLVFRGFLGRENPVIIELIDQTGNRVSLPKRSVVNKQVAEGSTMPKKLLDDLSLDQLSDLVAYLRLL